MYVIRFLSFYTIKSIDVTEAGGGVRTSIHTIYLCKPIAIAGSNMLGVGGVMINIHKYIEN